MPAHDVVERGRDAAIRHMRDLGAGGRIELLGRDVHRGAVAGRAVAHLARRPSPSRSELGRGLDRRIRLDDEQRRRGADTRDRREGLELVVAGLRLQGIRNDKCSDAREQDGAPVRGRAGRRSTASRPPAPPRFSTTTSVCSRGPSSAATNARERIDRTAGRERHDDLDGIGRVAPARQAAWRASAANSRFMIPPELFLGAMLPSIHQRGEIARDASNSSASRARVPRVVSGGNASRAKKP